ncbi:hypothetical protein BLGI_4438 [Brevibacillus laterosporus GI-9]|nr:hypothetical protein BLGI_4438 [Brevibacillus laterosporus GI-9]
MDLLEQMLPASLRDQTGRFPRSQGMDETYEALIRAWLY